MSNLIALLLVKSLLLNFEQTLRNELRPRLSQSSFLDGSSKFWEFLLINLDPTNLYSLAEIWGDLSWVQ